VAEKIEFKIPTNLAQAVDLYGEIKKQRLAKEKEAAVLEEQEKALKQHLINSIPKTSATGIAGKLWNVTVVLKDRVIIDAENGGWEAVAAWAKKNKLAPFEWMQKKLSDSVFKERIAAGKTIPGVRLDTYSDVSLKGAGK
jgi:hypothetical protein